MMYALTVNCKGVDQPKCLRLISDEMECPIVDKDL